MREVNGNVRDTTQFRHAFVLKPGPYKFGTLKEKCDRIIYATDGMANEVYEMRRQLEQSLVEFDPKTDVLIAVGSANLAVIAGMILTRLIERNAPMAWQSFALGVYTGEDYLFWRVPIGADEEPYEFTLQ